MWRIKKKLVGQGYDKVIQCLTPERVPTAPIVLKILYLSPFCWPVGSYCKPKQKVLKE